MKIHKNKSYLKCSECHEVFTKAKLLNHYQTHKPYFFQGEADEEDGDESEIITMDLGSEGLD
jgi:hypothetical protein